MMEDPVSDLGSTQKSPVNDLEFASAQCLTVRVALVESQDVESCSAAVDSVSPASSQKSHVEDVYSCRICMETITSNEFTESKALRLGCKCLDGLDIVHRKCAKKWFRLRRSPDCEICGEVAESLPEKLKLELLRMKDEPHRVYFDNGEFPSPREQRAAIPAWRHQASCIIPASFCLLLLILYIHWCMHIELASTIVLSAALSGVTVIHWLFTQDRFLWHSIYCSIHFFTIVFITSVFAFLYGWESAGSAIGGCLLGSVTSVGLYAGVRLIHLFCSPSLHQWGSNLLL